VIAPAALHSLDNPAHGALTGAHAHLAERRGRVLRYPADVAPWLALPAAPEPGDWADAAALAGPGGEMRLPGVHVAPPAGWEVIGQVACIQFTGEQVQPLADDEARPLTAADVPQMLDLVARTQPGPFLTRTIELGTYLGVWRGGRLIAMAGERLHPPGWTEISAVCTDPDHRGQGLATRLVRALAVGIRARGEQPFLHAITENAAALRLYAAMGFTPRRSATFVALRVPPALPGPRTAGLLAQGPAVPPGG
jgi:ribosomal protein S18 acetylase RimI-like enzyme